MSSGTSSPVMSASYWRDSNVNRWAYHGMQLVNVPAVDVVIYVIIYICDL